MSLINRYTIKYSSIGSISPFLNSQSENETNIISIYKKEIQDIYNLIKEVYPNNTVILSGDGALLLYANPVKNKDIIQSLEIPRILEFYVIEPNKETQINIEYIGDFKKTSQSLRKANFTNFWTINSIKSFNLSLIDKII